MQRRLGKIIVKKLRFFNTGKISLAKMYGWGDIFIVEMWVIPSSRHADFPHSSPLLAPLPSKVAKAGFWFKK